MPKALSANTERVVEALNRIAATSTRRENPTTTSHWEHRYFAMPGVTRDRIVWQSAIVREGEEPNWDREQRFVKCFVERAEGGYILYAGGWDAPAKWKDGPASEFTADEAEQYAEFVRDGGWGYKGDRKAWEDKRAEVTV